MRGTMISLTYRLVVVGVAEVGWVTLIFRLLFEHLYGNWGKLCCCGSLAQPFSIIIIYVDTSARPKC